MHRAPVSAEAFRVPATGPSTAVIGIIPGKILTARLEADIPFRDGLRHADPEHDLLKICVLERHGRNGNIGRGFVRGFGFRRGALASSVGHDSHNICVVGASDEDMALAVNRLLTLGGGLVAAENGRVTAGTLREVDIAGERNAFGYGDGLVGQKLAPESGVNRRSGLPTRQLRAG